MTASDKITISDWVRTTLDLNPDAGIRTAIKECCELNEINISQDELESLSFELTTETLIVNNLNKNIGNITSGLNF